MKQHQLIKHGNSIFIFILQVILVNQTNDRKSNFKYLFTIANLKRRLKTKVQSLNNVTN